MLLPTVDHDVLWLVALLLFLQVDVDIMIDQLLKPKGSKAAIKHHAVAENKMEQDLQPEDKY